MAERSTNEVDLKAPASLESSGEIPFELLGAEATLEQLAEVFLQDTLLRSLVPINGKNEVLNAEARFRALVEHMPAVVFMAYLDQGIGEAYVSPQIEAALGFTQDEWLEDPVRWYDQIYT